MGQNETSHNNAALYDLIPNDKGIFYRKEKSRCMRELHAAGNDPSGGKGHILSEHM